MDNRLMELEFVMGTRGYLRLKEVVEELRLLANSMSSEKALAEKIGISPAYLNDILSGRRNPGPMVLKFLKLEKRTVYVEKR